jgi:hypothetical protein
MSSSLRICTLFTVALFIHIIPTVYATFPPINDKCSNATIVTSSLNATLPFADRVNTRYATADFSNVTCSIMSTDIGVWYTVIGNNQNIEVDVTRKDGTSMSHSGVEVALFTGTCDTLKCLKSVTDQTENPVVNFSWNATVGQQYYIIVAGTSASTGTFIVNIEVCIGWMIKHISFVIISHAITNLLC